MDSELLSVKWNDHRSTFFEILATAREKKAFCDATIACEGNLYPVHCFVISTCSTYFESILKDVSDTHPVIVLADIKSKVIEDLLQYMYTGEVKVMQEDIDSLIKAGEVLKIKGIGGIGVADENEGEIEVADENEKPKKKKRIFNDSEERPEKRQRTDEFGNRSQLNASSRESKKNRAKISSEGSNEDATNKIEIDCSLDPSNQPVSEFTAVKEEIFQHSEDSSYFPEHHIKEEMCESLMEEEPAGCDKFDRTSEQDYDSLTSDNYHDISLSSMSPAQKMHMDWIVQNEYKGQASENRKLPLTGMCLVCSDRGSGYHYGIETCEGCKAFFKRSTRNNIGMDYNCVLGGECDISRASRGTCKACRFKKCLMSGMRVDNVRPDRSRGGSQKRSDGWPI